MDTQSPTKNLEDLGVVHRADSLNDAVAQLSVSSDIIGRGLQSAIDRNSTSSYTTAASAEDSEVSETQITFVAHKNSNEPPRSNRSPPAAAILPTLPTPSTDGSAV